MTNDVVELKRQNQRLKIALEQHHKWQLEAEGLFMFYVDPKTERIDCCDISMEYQDCDLHDITRRALIFQAELEGK